jgi:transaldolase
MRKAGAKDYKSYSMRILKICNNKPVSLEVFAGRAGDVGKDPVPEFKKSIALTKNYKNVEIL